MRKSIPKEIRRRVYEKYQHRCAYCGLELEDSDMQISMKIPYYQTEDASCYENILPACRLCNSYKRTLTVNEFRKKILGFRQVLLSNPKYQMLHRFGLISDEEDAKITFFFEQFTEENTEEE